MAKGLKRKHDHIGNLDSYTWDRQGCFDEVNSYKAGDKINFTELSRKYNLRNIQNEIPNNGGQVVKKYLEEQG